LNTLGLIGSQGDTALDFVLLSPLFCARRNKNTPRQKFGSLSQCAKSTIQNDPTTYANPALASPSEFLRIYPHARTCRRCAETRLDPHYSCADSTKPRLRCAVSCAFKSPKVRGRARKLRVFQRQSPRPRTFPASKVRVIPFFQPPNRTNTGTTPHSFVLRPHSALRTPLIDSGSSQPLR
jgi:hypothetical protein